jgi:hypothetical protein
LQVVPVAHMDEVLLHAIAFEKDDALQMRLETAKQASFSLDAVEPVGLATH